MSDLFMDQLTRFLSELRATLRDLQEDAANDEYCDFNSSGWLRTGAAIREIDGMLDAVTTERIRRKS